MTQIDAGTYVRTDSEGAYDAVYYFYYHYAPANRTSKSAMRGNYAKDVLWPRYT